jgi:type IV pilus assembly protein PilM
MLNAKSFLTVDFGAGSLKLAEFEVNEAGGLRLKQYALKSLGAEGAQESTREAVMQKALQELLAANGIRAKDVNVCAPGFHVFSKFVKLPPVDTSKVTQIIQYEAQQNVPFPLAEVVWDYQILGSTPGGELEVLLVAIKSDIVEGLFRVAESAGLRLQLADVSPAALCNAFRYNYGDLEDCTMLLDIGAKTSNLLFFEKGKVYSRSINLGANSITQDFATESKLPWADAEQKKISEGFVSLGGAYEEPENAHQAAISKIARQFMTRLHIQVNQTMQFYRGQQGGSAPQRLFLCGGASLMPYTAQFFAEKLNVPVEYFNPFRNVQIDPSINLEELARVAHSLGEVVGLGLRNLAHCPVELNLMPESTLNWVQFNQKKPYFIATVFSLVLVVFAGGFIFKKLADINQAELQNLEDKISPLQDRAERFKKDIAARNALHDEADQYAGWIQDRYYWADVLTELHGILIQVEARKAADLNYPVGLWIEQFITGPEAPVGSAGQPASDFNPMPAAVPAGGGGHFRNGPPPPPPVQAQAQLRISQASGTGGTSVYLFCRGVDLTTASTSGNLSANRDIANEFINELRESKLFDNQIQLPDRYDVDPNGTFSFGVTLKLKRPLKL